MTDVVNAGNNSYHICGINTSRRGSLLSCRAWVGIMVVFQVGQLFKQLGWNMQRSWRPFCPAGERAPQPLSNWEWEGGLVLRSQPSVLQEIKGKTYRPKTETLVFCLYFPPADFLSTAHKVVVYVLYVFFFFLNNFLNTFFPFESIRADGTSSLLRRAGLLSLITVLLKWI